MAVNSPWKNKSINYVTDSQNWRNSVRVWANVKTCLKKINVTENLEKITLEYVKKNFDEMLRNFIRSIHFDRSRSFNFKNM